MSSYCSGQRLLPHICCTQWTALAAPHANLICHVTPRGTEKPLQTILESDLRRPHSFRCYCKSKTITITCHVVKLNHDDLQTSDVGLLALWGCKNRHQKYDVFPAYGDKILFSFLTSTSLMVIPLWKFVTLFVCVYAKSEHISGMWSGPAYVHWHSGASGWKTKQKIFASFIKICHRNIGKDFFLPCVRPDGHSR